MRTGADEARLPKYSHVERERRFLVDRARLPELPHHYFQIEDRYIVGTRLRLRRMTSNVSGDTVLKLAKKYESDDPLARPMVNAYLSQDEYDVLMSLPAKSIVKRRYRISDGGDSFSIDVFAGQLAGFVLAEVECATAAALVAVLQPKWVQEEVSGDPKYQSGALADLHAAPR